MIAPRRAAVALAVAVAAGLGGCGSSGPSTVELVRAQERVGVGRSLAACVAQAAGHRLGVRERRLLATDPGGLPPDVSAKVTKLAAECAISTAPPFAPTTRP